MLLVYFGWIIWRLVRCLHFLFYWSPWKIWPLHGQWQLWKHLQNLSLAASWLLKILQFFLILGQFLWIQTLLKLPFLFLQQVLQVLRMPLLGRLLLVVQCRMTLRHQWNWLPLATIKITGFKFSLLEALQVSHAHLVPQAIILDRILQNHMLSTLDCVGPCYQTVYGRLFQCWLLLKRFIDGRLLDLVIIITVVELRCVHGVICIRQRILWFTLFNYLHTLILLMAWNLNICLVPVSLFYAPGTQWWLCITPLRITFLIWSDRKLFAWTPN